MSQRRLVLAALPLLLAACATTGTRPAASIPAHTGEAPVTAGEGAAQPARVSPYAPAQEDPSKRGDYVAGGLFQPGVPDTVPADIPDVDAIPEPVVRDEPRARTGNRDYVVQGRKYRVLDDAEGYVEEGNASYYGNKFHGRRTSSSEVYDMYAFTAAHRTLPLPSYARVTNLANGRSVIVRINDRGPFHSNRIIDLSYAAAVKLGYRDRGTARVRVEALTPEDAAADSVAHAPPPTTPATPSGMDRLVAGLPPDATPANAPAPARAPSTPSTPAAATAQVAMATPTDGRFRMQQAGRNMTADDFDGWMRDRGIHVATGRPMPAVAPASTTAPAAADAAPRSEPAVAVAASMAQVSEPADANRGAVTPDVSDRVAMPALSAHAVVFQVASFSNEANAKQALSVLLHAAITRVRLLVAEVGGRQVWRLRVGPVEPEAAAELASRIEGLGLGRPQPVTD